MSAPLHSPRLVAIGGLDPTGGAGVVRDFLTARTLGAIVRVVPTAWTTQSTGGVQAIEPRAPSALAADIRAALCDLAQSGDDRAAAGLLTVKIGMIPDAGAVTAVLDALSGFNGPVVLDPVLSASRGGRLFSGDVGALIELGARATVVTPNTIEAGLLAGLSVRVLSEATAAGVALCSKGWRAALIKGGHLDGDVATDVLVSAEGDVRQFHAARVPGPSRRGTGCALATAISVALGRGLPLGDAIADAKEWLAGAIKGAIAVGDEWHLS